LLASGQTLKFPGLGSSPKETALLLLPVSIVALIANPVISALIPVIGPKILFILGFGFTIPGSILLSFMTTNDSYFRTAFPGLILVVIGICSVYFTSSYIAMSSADKKHQGMIAGIYNVALQVGGSMLGLAIFLTVGEAMSLGSGGPTTDGSLRPIGYQAVYYSSAIMSGVGLLAALIFIKSPAKPPAPEKEVVDETPSVVASSVDLSSLQEEGLADENSKEKEKENLELDSTGSQKTL
jgi:MFS family permease